MIDSAPDVRPATLPADDPGIPLADAPAEGTLHDLEPVARRAFKALNRWFMVPLHRAGLGAWLGTPIGGWMLLLRVRGRKTGIVRETPLNYLVADGAVWIVAGFGVGTQWYRNLAADPSVDVWLPGRRIAGRAIEVRDPETRARILPALMRATGLPACMAGINPWAASTEQVLRALDFVPLIRIDPADGAIEPGPDDPGGTSWVWRQATVLLLTVAALRALRRLVR